MTIQISFPNLLCDSQAKWLFKIFHFNKMDKLKNETKLEKQETTKMAGGVVKERTVVVSEAKV